MLDRVGFVPSRDWAWLRDSGLLRPAAIKPLHLPASFLVIVHNFRHKYKISILSLLKGVFKCQLEVNRITDSTKELMVRGEHQVLVFSLDPPLMLLHFVVDRFDCVGGNSIQSSG